ELGPRAGAGMRRGSIVTMAPVTPLPTFVFSCIYRPAFLALYLRRLRELGLEVPEAGRYARWCGDGLELRRGEILRLAAGCSTTARSYWPTGWLRTHRWRWRRLPTARG